MYTRWRRFVNYPPSGTARLYFSIVLRSFPLAPISVSLCFLFIYFEINLLVDCSSSQHTYQIWLQDTVFYVCCKFSLSSQATLELPVFCFERKKKASKQPFQYWSNICPYWFIPLRPSSWEAEFKFCVWCALLLHNIGIVKLYIYGENALIWYNFIIFSVKKNSFGCVTMHVSTGPFYKAAESRMDKL